MPNPVHKRPGIPGKGTKGLGEISKQGPAAKAYAGAPLAGAQGHEGESAGDGGVRVTTGKGG